MFYQISLLFFIDILSSIGYSLLAPLYPSQALEKGVSELTIGIIFSSFAISNVITIPFTSKLINIFGRKRIFYAAMIIEV